MVAVKSIIVDGEAVICTSDIEVSRRLTISDVSTAVVVLSIGVGVSVVVWKMVVVSVKRVLKSVLSVRLEISVVFTSVDVPDIIVVIASLVVLAVRLEISVVNTFIAVL